MFVEVRNQPVELTSLLLPHESLGPGLVTGTFKPPHVCSLQKCQKVQKKKETTHPASLPNRMTLLGKGTCQHGYGRPEAHTPVLSFHRRGFWGSDSGHQKWQQAPFPAKPSCYSTSHSGSICYSTSHSGSNMNIMVRTNLVFVTVLT